MDKISQKLFSRVKQFSTYRSQVLNSFGFTIIELLVVLTLVGLVSGIGIFSLVTYGRIQAMDSTASGVKTVFDEAKFNAISSVVLETSDAGEQITCSGGLVGYRVDVLSGLTDSVVMSIECGSDVEEIRRYTLQEEVTFGDATFCDQVRYVAVTSQVMSDAELPCTIELVGYDSSKILTINTLGNVTID